MKHFYTFTFLLFTLMGLNAQDDVVFDFNTTGDTEGWTNIPSNTTVVSQLDGQLHVGSDISNYGGTYTTLDLASDDYDFVEITVSSFTGLTNGLQLLNFDSTFSPGTASKTNITVADGSTETYLVAIPATPSANNGVILGLGIRVKGNPDPGAYFSIDNFTIVGAVESTYDESGITKNPSFEDITGSLGNWVEAGGSNITRGISTTEFSEGVQSAEFTFQENVTSNPPMLYSNNIYTLTDLNDNTAEITMTWDMKATDVTTNVQVSPRWRMTKSSGGQRVTYPSLSNATTEWASYSTTKPLSNTCAGATDPVEGTNCFDLESYTDLEVGIAAKGGSAGVVLYIDNIVTTITASSLGIEEINLQDTASISLFPNPANDFITVKSSSEIVSMKAVNMLGQIVIIQTGNSNNLNISTLSPGLYVLKLIDSKGLKTQKQFIKN